MVPDPAEADLDFLDLEPEGPLDSALVWLHGLGADGRDFAPFFRDPAFSLPRARILLPHAPVRPVTMNGGLSMRGWYDIRDPDVTVEPDLPGIRDSARRIGALLEALEHLGLESTRIAVGGFSQGGVLALWTGLGYPRPLAGIAAASAYLPDDPPLAPVQRRTPLWLGHGRHDSLIPFTLGVAARERLRTLGASDPVWREYPMDHAVSENEMGDLTRWLGGILG